MIKGIFVFDDIHTQCFDRPHGSGRRTVDLRIWFDGVNRNSDKRGAIIIEPDEGVQRDAFVRAASRFVEDAPGYVVLDVAKSRPDVLWRPDDFTEFAGVIRSALIDGGWDGRSIEMLGDAFLPELLAWPMRKIKEILGIDSTPAFKRHDGTPIPFERYWSLSA